MHLAVLVDKITARTPPIAFVSAHGVIVKGFDAVHSAASILRLRRIS